MAAGCHGYIHIWLDPVSLENILLGMDVSWLRPRSANEIFDGARSDGWKGTTASQISDGDICW
jgi:hypothetical protein